MIHDIAIVDDDEIAAFLTSKIIAQTHLVDNIMLFTGASETIQFLKANSDHAENLPDIILLDLNMPLIDGWGFIEEYIKLKPILGKKIAIFMLSSSVSPKDIIRAKNINEVSDYIVKPSSHDKFKDVVELYKRKYSSKDFTNV
jgi:CheY-like chemotaxis protein